MNKLLLAAFLQLAIISGAYAAGYEDSQEAQQGAQQYDWQSCLNDKTNECISDCQNSEDISCSDNCDELASSKCQSLGLTPPSQ